MLKFNEVIYLIAMLTASVVAVEAQSISTRSTGGKSVTNQSSSLVVETDRFSDTTTITLKPQNVFDTPSHQLSVSVETKISDKPQIGLSELDERAEMNFISLSKSGIDFGDEELHFLVDGKRMRIGAFAEGLASRNESTQRPDLRVKSRLTTTLSLEQLRQVARGKQVEMRLGSVETPLSPQLLKSLNEFVQHYEQAKGRAKQ